MESSFESICDQTVIRETSMIFHKTLANIRKKHGFSQDEFAKALGCTRELIVALESNKEQATFAFVTNLKDKLNLHSAPITESERATLMDSLYKWKLAIDYGDMDVAKAQKPELEKAAKNSYSPSTLNFYDLYSASYYWAVGDKDAFNQVADALSKRTGEFSARHLYHYYRIEASRNYIAYRFVESLKMYKAAEKLDKNSEWGNVGFYYGYGMCLSSLDYPSRAIECFKKAQHIAKWHKAYKGKPNARYNFYIDTVLSDDLSLLGGLDEALAMLDKHLKIESENKINLRMGELYLAYATAYLRAKRYDEALENFDTAAKYFNTDGMKCKTTLYRKSLCLIESGNIEDGLRCIEEGFSIQMDDAYRVLFEALKCSVSLNDSESLRHMEDIVLPKLLRHSHNSEAIKYSKLLGEFFGEKGCYEAAFKYSNVALKVIEHLYYEYVEGGL